MGVGSSERPASMAATPPAARAMTSTRIRAGFITLHFPQITLRPNRCATADTTPRPTRGRACRFQQLNVKAWLMRRIQIELIVGHPIGCELRGRYEVSVAIQDVSG